MKKKVLMIIGAATLLYAVLTGMRGIVPESDQQPLAGHQWTTIPDATAAPAAPVTVAARTSFDPAEAAKLFSANCAVCHQESGEGVAGVFPPLKGDVVVLAADPSRQISVILGGLHGVNVGGVVYPSQMPPFGSALTDSQIAEIIDHERTSWGNHAPLATAAEVARVRAKDKK